MKEKNSTETDHRRLHTIIHGRVQGVGFRAFTQRIGVQYGLTGWVRNRWNGTVETVAEGSHKDLEIFLQALYRGPFSGTTRHINENWQDASGQFTSFSIRMTA